MTNVTITMEGSVAEWTRLEAARRNTSVSRLVGEMLAEKMRHDDACEPAMREACRLSPLCPRLPRLFPPCLPNVSGRRLPEPGA